MFNRYHRRIYSPPRRLFNTWFPIRPRISRTFFLCKSDASCRIPHSPPLWLTAVNLNCFGCNSPLSSDYLFSEWRNSSPSFFLGDYNLKRLTYVHYCLTHYQLSFLPSAPPPRPYLLFNRNRRPNFHPSRTIHLQLNQNRKKCRRWRQKLSRATTTTATTTTNNRQPTITTNNNSNSTNQYHARFKGSKTLITGGTTTISSIIIFY